MYSDYLRSDHWQEVRSSRLSIEKECIVCGSTEKLHLHHRRYSITEKESLRTGENSGSILGREKDKDIYVLCSSCHAYWHANFAKRFFTKNKLLKVKRLLVLGVSKKHAFWTSAHPQLYNTVYHEAKRRFNQVKNNTFEPACGGGTASPTD